jgi:glutamate/tyrosine decarboxylase-like PLP-dependent enzyme
MTNSFDGLHRAQQHAIEFLASLEHRPVQATVGLETLRERLGGKTPESGSAAVTVIDDLVAATAGGHLGSAGGRFFAWVIGGSLESALAADWLTSVWDQNAALYACAPAAAVAEEVAGAWLKDLLDLPAEASFAFTTGCQLAHFTCLAAARHRVLSDAGWDVNSDGLFGAPPIRVLTSDQRHGSIDRAVRFLGLGNRNLVAIPTNADGQIQADELQRALAAGKGPTIVVLDAADLNVAAFDSFASVIPAAKAAKAWVHVDGAFGLFARASRQKRWLTAGLELADSWATDGHKWLNVPFDCGFAAVRDREAHRASMTVSASYIAAEGRARDQIDWNPEWSRRARGFAVYAAIRELGRSGLEALIERSCAHAHRLVKGIGGLPGAQVLWEPRLNQGLVRFRDDPTTDRVIAAVNSTGEAFFSGTTWRGMRAMRVSVVNWRTTASDVERAIAAVAAVLVRDLRAQHARETI